MTRFKRLSSGFSAAVLGLSSLMTFGFTGVAQAVAKTCTWTGTGSDNKFSTAANWSGCNSAAPGAGDSIVLSTVSPAAQTLNNDLSVALGNVQISNTTNTNTTYIINHLTLADGATINDSQTLGYTTVYIGTSTSALAPITAQGSLTVTDANDSNVHIYPSAWNVGGVLTIGSGVNFYTSSTGAQGYVIQNGAFLDLDPGSSTSPTLSVPITFGGGPSVDAPMLELDAICGDGGQGCAYTPATWTVSSPITLLGNALISPGDQSTVNVTGSIAGSGFTLGKDPSAYGNGILNINPSSNTSNTQTGTITPPVVTNTLSDAAPTTDVSVGQNVTDIIDGSRRNVYTVNNGVIKGTGTIQYLSIDDGGTVAPGHSPGKLTVTSNLYLGGGSTYQAELKDATPGDYDQIQAGQPTDTDNTQPDVTLGDFDTNGTETKASTLNVVLYAGYNIKAGDTFTIIDNQSKTDIKGTFASLPEGATFKVGTGVFKITYKGGDGNDVVLTAVTAPTTPDTGFAVVAAHPGVTLGVAVLAAGAIIFMAKKMRPTPVRVRVSSKSSRRK